VDRTLLSSLGFDTDGSRVRILLVSSDSGDGLPGAGVAHMTQTRAHDSKILASGRVVHEVLLRPPFDYTTESSLASTGYSKMQAVILEDLRVVEGAVQ